MIGARAVAIDGEERVQRIDSDDRSAGAGGRRRGLAQRREVADALVVGPPQRIEVGGEAEPACARGNVVRREAARRRDDQRAGMIALVVEEKPGARRAEGQAA